MKTFSLLVFFGITSVALCHVVRDEPKSCSCGASNPSRIVNGLVVSPEHKYPWQVGIKIKGDEKYYCGGSIINDRYILTAAHCFYEKGNRTSDVDLVVGVGDFNMLSTTDDVKATALINAEKVLIHPKYDIKNGNNDNDIAIIKLTSNLELSKFKEIGAVCIPKEDKTYAGYNGIVSGWGRLSDGGKQPAKLMEVTLPILEQDCWGVDGITSNMMCAGYENGGKDSCQGDSGGPFVVKESDKFYQVGVVSFGQGCAEPASPGVYARVTKYMDWIRTNTKTDATCYA